MLIPFTAASPEPPQVLVDVAGHALFQSTLHEDIGTLSNILNVTAGNLTTDYAAGSVSSEIDLRFVGRLTLWIVADSSAGAAPDSIVVKLFPRNITAGTDYEETTGSDTSGVVTLSLKEWKFVPVASATKNFVIQGIDVTGYNHAVVKVKGTGTLTNLAVSIKRTRTPTG